MSADRVPACAPAARFRLFNPETTRNDDPAGGLSPAMTVESFWKSYVLPVVGKSCAWSKWTVASYGESVHYWTALTDNSGLEAIDAYQTADFVAGLRMQPGRSAEFFSTENVRKHCAQLQRVLSIAGPRMRRQKDDVRRFGAGLIAEPPWIEAPEAEERIPDGDFTHAEILAILAACPQMTVPHLRSLTAPTWWAALINFLCATGLRIGTAMDLEWSMIAGDRLVIPGAIAKRKRPHVQYLHPTIAAMIEPLRGLSSRIFYWPNWPCPGAVRWLQRNREKLVERAGLPEHRQFGFHGLRKYHATEVFEAAGLEAAALSLNHKSGATTSAHYVNHRSQLDANVRQQRSAIERMRLLNG